MWGHWLVEWKRWFSIVLLRFEGLSREAFHTHAFGCVSWVLWGMLIEQHLDGRIQVHTPSWRPVITRRSTFHKVDSVGRTWVLSFRGPWAAWWHEYIPETGTILTLLSGRRVISTSTPIGRHRVGVVWESASRQ